MRRIKNLHNEVSRVFRGCLKNSPTSFHIFASMRIGFDAKRAFFNPTGLGNYSRSLLLALARYFPENSYCLFSPIQKKLNLFPESGMPPFENVHPASFLGKTFPSLWRSLLLSKEIQKQKLSIFHGLSNELPQGLKKKKIPSVVTIHDLIFMRNPEQYSWIDRAFYKRKFESACKNANAIVATSEATKKDIVEFFGIEKEKIEVVYQSIEERFYVSSQESEIAKARTKWSLPSRFFLSVGSLIPRKNLLVILKAMKEAEPEFNLPLVVVGNGKKYETELLHFIQKHKMEKSVHFLKQVSGHELQCLYAAAEFLVYPSLYEGFGIPVLEAMASGTPVITSAGSSMQEICGNAALYCNASHSEDWGKALLLLQNNETTLTLLKEKGKIRASALSPESHVAQMMKIYKKIV